MTKSTTDKFAWMLLISLAALSLLFAGCAADGRAPEEAVTAPGIPERTVRVETMILRPSTFEDVVELSGTVEALGDATLSAQAAGTVTYLAPLGRQVAAGDVVARLDDRLVRAAVQQAEATVAAAQASFAMADDLLKRQTPLYRDSVISAVEFEQTRTGQAQAQAQLAQAKAALAQVTEQLRNTRITAPFAGRIEANFVEAGEQVTPGRQVARVVDTRRVKVTAGVPERYAADVRLGTPMSVDFQAYRGQPRTGRVTFAGSTVNAQTRTFPVEVELNNEDGLLKPQMVARVRLARQQIDGALVVPREAVVNDENGTSVFVVGRTGSTAVANRRAIEQGPAFGGSTVVGGLAEGDEVVVLGQNSLADGDYVQVVRQRGVGAGE